MKESSDYGEHDIPREWSKAAAKENNRSRDSSQVSKVAIKAGGDEMSYEGSRVTEKMKSDYYAIRRAFDVCREEVKCVVTTTVNGLSKVNASFDKAGNEADKRWNEIEKAVTVSLERNERETRFLERIGLNSLVEVETELRANREELELFKLLVENVNALEQVNDIPELLMKMNDEREAFQRERSGWERAKAEFHELNGVMKLEGNERFIDRVHSMNEELQMLTDKVERMKVQADMEEGKLLFYKNKVEQLEHQNAILLKEEKRFIGQTVPQRRMEDTSAGQRGMSPMGNSMTPGGTKVNPGARLNSGSGLRNSDGVLGESVGMLANALPEMEKYSGKKEDWDDFETGFMIRYGRMDPKVAMSLLKDHLEGEAKDALRSVPVEEKANGVSCVLSWLRSRLSNETPFEEIELEKMLRHQTVEGKTVGMICEELEKWTAKLNGTDGVSTETARKRQLLILYEGSHVEHARLLSLFMEGTSYAKMKAALVEIEYLRMTELRNRSGIGAEWKNNNGRDMGWRYSNGMSSELECSCCGGHGHDEYHCASNGEGGYMGDQ